MDAQQVKLWEPGDWNGFFGLGTNVLVYDEEIVRLFEFLKLPGDVLLRGWWAIGEIGESTGPGNHANPLGSVEGNLVQRSRAGEHM